MKLEDEKKFSKIGSSWGVIIPAWFFKVLDIDPKIDKAQLSIEDNKIVIRKK